MREILFRGKAKIGGFWFEGAYVPENKIIIGYFEVRGHGPNEDLTDCKCVIHKVLPKTIGQYTGLTDKNGKRIFEGDILKSFDALYTVDWIEESAMFYLKPINVSEGYDFDTINSTCYEIIGNIHDNPELLNKEVTQNGG